MEKLLQPDVGLMVWTAVTFVCLLVVLTVFVWRPVLDAVNKRESKIRGDIDRAEAAQKEAEALRQKFEGQLADAQRTIQDMVSQARSDSEKTRQQIVAAAKEEAGGVMEKGRQDLLLEAERLKGELRKEVADLSVKVAEKLLHRSVDEKVQQDVFKESLKFTSEVRR
ncbi:MAG: F0F1 ATP synthase subunit B [Elusimicrobia bacterium]|nr:F0F1 ATP synthase subunit B [Candidatus Obscuribacterium magneticum]MCB4756363.1 F0F1 ATP synthase subunit B [Candidatus Obscuribacterium magneticum]